MTDRRRWVCQEIVRDSEADVYRFEHAPFTGKTVAEYMGNQAAMIQALAKIVETLLPADEDLEQRVGRILESMPRPDYPTDS